MLLELRPVLGPPSGSDPSGLTGRMSVEMSSTEPLPTGHSESRELPVPELLRRARPLPPPDDMVIDDLTEEEGAAFLAALEA